MALFSNELSQKTWENVVKTDDVNQAYDSFLHIFMDLFNRHLYNGRERHLQNQNKNKNVKKLTNIYINNYRNKLL